MEIEINEGDEEVGGRIYSSQMGSAIVATLPDHYRAIPNILNSRFAPLP